MSDPQLDILTGKESSLVIGVDPGGEGCAAILTDTGRLIDFLHMPMLKIDKAKRVNGAALAAWIGRYSISHCYFEKVGAMPGQGGSSMFSFGHSAGMAEGVITALQIPMSHITPQAWKKTHGLIGKDKDAARSRVIQLYPDCRELDLKAKGQALADAILIARHGLAA